MDQQKEQQTAELLKECSQGCKMALNSMEQVGEYIRDTEMKRVFREYRDKYRKIEDEAIQLAGGCGQQETASDKMAEAFSWMTAEVKLRIRDDHSQIAKMMMDGANMGVKSIVEKMNQCPSASGDSVSLAKRFEKCNEKLAEEMKQFL